MRAAFEPLTGPGVRVVGASRTDAGVHALGQVASVASDRTLSPRVAQAALNARLPRDVRVLAARGVGPEFDARRSARLKRYAYLISEAPVPSPFLRGYAWHVGRRLDAAALQTALLPLRGTHDFSAFQAAAGRDRRPVCTVRSVRVVRQGALLAVLVSADAFLHHMVRAIVGSGVEVGRGRRPPGWLSEVLAGRDRRQAGPTAPAHGLVLVSVRYPMPLFPGRARLRRPPSARQPSD